jgi:hypothetical protein
MVCFAGVFCLLDLLYLSLGVPDLPSHRLAEAPPEVGSMPKKIITGNALVPNLEFDRELHSYAIAGKPFYSVSDTIALFGFGGKSYEGIPAWALRVGTLRHEITELDDFGELDEESVHPKLLPALEGWRQWRADNPKAELVAIEAMVCSQTLGLAGTIDRVFSVEGQTWVVDIKGGTNSKSYPLQLTSYAMMWEELTGQRVDRLVTVHLGSKPTYKERDQPRHDEEWTRIAEVASMMRRGLFGYKGDG